MGSRMCSIFFFCVYVYIYYAVFSLPTFKHITINTSWPSKIIIYHYATCQPEIQLLLTKPLAWTCLLQLARLGNAVWSRRVRPRELRMFVANRSIQNCRLWLSDAIAIAHDLSCGNNLKLRTTCIAPITLVLSIQQIFRIILCSIGENGSFLAPVLQVKARAYKLCESIHPWWSQVCSHTCTSEAPVCD